jgi:chromosome segregation ATPase
MTDTKIPGGGRLRGSRNTAETYRVLLEVEVKSVIKRVGELTESTASLFEAVNDIALNIEEAVVRLERLSGGLQYCREEIGALHRRIQNHDDTIKQLQVKLGTLRERLVQLEKQSAFEGDPIPSE